MTVPLLTLNYIKVEVTVVVQFDCGLICDHSNWCLKSSNMTNVIESIACTNVQEVIVIVSNACKHYGSRNKTIHVLRNLNMTVPKGVIYGLLGSSGCGKTTLLNCMIGMKKLNSGEIWVMGGAPGTKESKVPGPKIGYMPQSVGVQLEFTTRETMQYFGAIAGLSSEKIKEKINFLMKLLMLPDVDKPLRNLSGGEQRRISFAVALMHDPELLILDEPTVGLDPILRESIWNHLLNLTTRGSITVILTTHYIDEARHANTVALLRDGHLLCEEAPDILLSRLSVTTLEDAFLVLSDKQCKQTTHSQIVKSSSENNNYAHLVKHQRITCETKRTHLKPLLRKNSQWLLKSPELILFSIVVPVLQVLIFHLAIGHDPTKLTFAISNYETNLTNCSVPTCESDLLSCNFLHYLQTPKISLLHFHNEQGALQAVFRGNVDASIFFKHNYTLALKERLELSSKLHHWDASHSSIDIVRDVITYNIPLFVKKEIFNKFNEFIGDYLESCGKERNILSLPIKWNEHIYGQDLPDFTQFAVPALVLSGISFFSAIAIASTLLTEFQSGVTERTLVLGVGHFYIVMSHLVTEFALTTCHIAAVFVFLFFVMQIPLQGSMLLILLMFLLMALWGLGFGVVLATVCTSDSAATYVIIGSFFPAGVLSGLVWPVEGMPKIIQIIATILPFAGIADSTRSILQRGWDLTNPQLYISVICVTIWIIMFFILSILIVKLKKN